MKPITKLVFVIAAAIGAALLGNFLTKPWFGPVQYQLTCTTEEDLVIQRSTTDRATFLKCATRKSEIFLAKDYAESKDLAKTFLTLLTAILVGSITFSEKIVDIHNSKKTPLYAMVVCWFLLLLAMVLTGSGLASMALGAGYAAHFPDADYWLFERHAVPLFVGGCLAFGVAMLALITAGVISLSDKRTQTIAGVSAPDKRVVATARDEAPDTALEQD